MSISPSDVASAIKLGLWIYDKYFVRINRANERYMEFGNDIRFLATQLDRLGKVFQRANEQHRDRTIRSSRDLEIERQELVGDFHKTLKQSLQLLEENSRCSSCGFVDTMRWYSTGIESQSILLRNRLQFHCAKIHFILKPLELELLASIDRNIAILRRQGREQIGLLRSLRMRESQLIAGGVPSRVDRFGLVEVPLELNERYEKQAMKTRPFDSPESYPLRETLNALLYHFNESTIHAGGGYFTLNQYNSLIKSRWILGKLLESRHYQELGPCLSRTTIEDIEEEIHIQYSRFEDNWDTVQARSIATLGDEHFTIWIVEEVEPLSTVVTDEGAGEVKILELPLPAPQGFSQRSLLVFRQSDTEYRLLRTSILDGANLELPSEKQIVNVHYFRLVPFYAVPDSQEPANNVWICHSHVHQGDIFDMRTQKDTFAFQRALTGYSVAYSGKVKWELQRDGFFKKSMKGKGWSGLQIWDWDPLSRVESPETEPQSPSETLNGQRSNSDARASTMADVVASMPGNAASILTSPNGPSGSQDIIASSAPKIPILMLFTYVSGKLSFLHVPLEPGMGINFERCGCRVKNSVCRHSVLEQNPAKKGKFKIKQHSAVSDADGQPIYADWDLLIFGQPRHPRFASLETIDSVTWLDLELPTSDDRKRFQIALLRSLKLYNEKLEHYHHVRNTMQALDQRPNAASRHRTSSAGTHPFRTNSVVLPNPQLAQDPRRTSTITSSSTTASLSDERSQLALASGAIPCSPAPSTSTQSSSLASTTPTPITNPACRASTIHTPSPFGTVAEDDEPKIQKL